MIDLSNRVHLFANPSERDELDRLFTEILGLPTAVSLDVPVYDGPVRVYRLTNGASISVEFTLKNPHNGEVRRGAELVVDDLATVTNKVLEAGLRQIEFQGNDHFYFEAPGGQIFRLIDQERLQRRSRGVTRPLHKGDTDRSGRRFQRVPRSRSWRDTGAVTAGAVDPECIDSTSQGRLLA